jgi:hypothetical protein
MSVDEHRFKKIETPALINFLFLQGKAPKEIHAIQRETIEKRALPFATIKTWEAQICPHVVRLDLDDTKQ